MVLNLDPVGMLLVLIKPDQDQLLLSLPMLLRPIPQPLRDCSLWQQGAPELYEGMLRPPDPRGTRREMMMGQPRLELLVELLLPLGE